MDIHKIDKLESLIAEACKPFIGMPIAMSGGIDSSTLAYFIKPKFGIIIVSPGREVYDELKYAKMVSKHLGFGLEIVKATEKGFLRDIKEIIKIQNAISYHFNTYPLYLLFKTLCDRGEKNIVIADGPDESLSGYTRNIIMKYLYDSYEVEAFVPYKELLDKLLPRPEDAYQKLSGVENRPHGSFKSLIQYMNRIDMEYKRPEMDLMGNRFAEHFKITKHKPYETKKVDNFMFNLPDEYKIFGEYGKYALRLIADRYLPREIAWRKIKRGGPIFPVNKVMKWNVKEFDKENWIRFQREVLGQK